MKKVVLIGGAGEVGQLLNKGLKDDYELVTIDLKPKPADWHGEYIQADATNYESLQNAVPKDTHVILDLVKLAHQSPEKIDPPSEIPKLSAVYMNASVNALHAARELKIPRVIFASSNHVTGTYEKDGYSTLGREITVHDQPAPDSVYGAMKLAVEGIGKLFHDTHQLSFIGLRIGTVSVFQDEQLPTRDRWNRTILSQMDTVGIYKAAIETATQYGIFYAVSDNPNKPWSLEDTKEKLGFKPAENSVQIMNRLQSAKGFTPMRDGAGVYSLVKNDQVSDGARLTVKNH